MRYPRNFQYLILILFYIDIMGLTQVELQYSNTIYIMKIEKNAWSRIIENNAFRLSVHVIMYQTLFLSIFLEHLQWYFNNLLKKLPYIRDRSKSGMKSKKTKFFVWGRGLRAHFVSFLKNCLRHIITPYRLKNV